MTENKTSNKFIMNEYIDVNVKQNLVKLCCDCYKELGWDVINTSSSVDSVTMKMQRNRKIKNRAALCDLQRKCEQAFTSIEKLERTKTSKATGISLGIGIIGTAFMAGSVFAYLASMIVFCIILAIPAFVGWALPYFFYKKIYNESVGVCSEYGCIEFIEPTENICSGGTTYGYPCESSQDCGTNGSYSCVSDENTGNKYCISTVGYGVGDVNKNGSSCKLDTQCGFGGECIGNNNYTYINNNKIDKTSCSTVSRQEGCVLFNDTSNSVLSYASEYTYLKANQNSGRGVAPQVGDSSGGAKQKDSNVIIKVKRDRECAEWLSFDNKKFVSSIVNTNNTGTDTCIELDSDGSCKISGIGWNTGLNASYYKSQMRGEWSNNDFSGFSIYGKLSVDNNWWTNPFVDGYGRNISPNSTATSGTIAGVIDNLICKKYPEKDSPFNFTDKYETEYVSGYGYGYYCSGEIYSTSNDCQNACYFGSNLRGVCAGGSVFKCCIESSVVLNNGLNGYGLPFDVYKNKNLRTYFKAVNSGLSSMEHRSDPVTGWSNTNPIRYIISDNQECYYQKATYKDFYQTQYYQPSYKIFDEVCEERGDKSFSADDIHACYRAADSGIYSKNYKLKEIIDYSKSDTPANYRQGYCLEFDYTKELYYVGSGKYNCINWMPGFVGK